MTAANFDACLKVILASEGGYNPNDGTGVGATEMGITQRTLSGWLGRSATATDVKALTLATVTSIYKTDYWNMIRGDELPGGIDLVAFDEAVNQGPARAVRSLQTALSTTVDGALGPITMGAVAASNASMIIDRIVTNRTTLYHQASEWPVYGKQWMARLYRTAGLAHAMVGSVQPPQPTSTPSPVVPVPAPPVAPLPGPVQEPPVTTQTPTEQQAIDVLLPLIVQTIETAKGQTLSASNILTDAKPFLQSKTIWGLLIAGAAVIAGQLGYNFAPSDQADLINDATTIVSALGLVFATVGRVTATKALK